MIKAVVARVLNRCYNSLFKFILVLFGQGGIIRFEACSPFLGNQNLLCSYFFYFTPVTFDISVTCGIITVSDGSDTDIVSFATL